MDFDLPKEITDKLAELDAFIEAEIKPLERENMQFFDHRREHARTDWDHDGRPRVEWRALISEMERRADKAGLCRKTQDVLVRDRRQRVVVFTAR